MVLPRWAPKRGFGLIEMLLVLSLIAILAAMAVPAFLTIVPTAQLRGSARSVVSLIQRARLLAENTQKPVRVALDCRETAASSPQCVARLYSAVFKPDGALDSWAEVDMASRALAPRVRLAADLTSTAVAGNPDDLFWAVFLPSGQMRGSHDPLRLVFSRPGVPRTWELAVSQGSGRATLRWLE